MKRLLSGCLLFATLLSSSPTTAEAQWFKGATHVHSLWSDGDAAPEIIADWYKTHGWDFMCFSEHNILMEGEKLVPVVEDGKLTSARLLAIQQRFGKSWIELRQVASTRQMRLKTLAELTTHFADPGKFLFIPAEEMTTKGGNPHMNVVNVREVVPGASQEGDPVPKMQGYIDTIRAQETKFNVPMLVHLNHPDWSNPITTENMLALTGLDFFEVYNGAGPTDHGYPDKGVPTTERHWDVVMSMQLRRIPDYILYGVATDDSHNYHTFANGQANPGRGWVMVRAESLEADAIVTAMKRGDFYGSTGVTLNKVERAPGRLAVEIAGEPGVSYTTRYIGTRKGFDTAAKPVHDAQGNPLPGASQIYSEAIGEVFLETTDLSSAYEITGDELYVRAVVTSDKAKENPPVASDLEMAWVQPVLAK